MEYLDEMELLLILEEYFKMLDNTSDGYEEAFIREEIFRLREFFADY